MRPHDVFTSVKAEYGEEIAVMVVAVNAIHKATKVKGKDLDEKGRYSQRIKDKVKDALYGETYQDVDLAFDIAMQLYVYDCCRTLGEPGGGIGGCLPKTLKQLVRDQS